MLSEQGGIYFFSCSFAVVVAAAAAVVVLAAVVVVAAAALPDVSAAAEFSLRVFLHLDSNRNYRGGKCEKVRKTKPYFVFRSATRL